MNDARIPTLAECLEQSPWRRLWAVAVLHDVPRQPRPAKAELARRLQECLTRAAVWDAQLPALAAEEREALEALTTAGGRLPRWPFERRFGPIRAYRPWRADSPQAPWRTPCSVAEHLWYLGVIHPWPPRPKPGEVQEVLVPQELLALLVAHLTSLSSEGEERGEHRAADDGRWDVAMLLGLLYGEDIRPLHGRWLPPWALRDLNARFSVPEELGEARSERKVRRLSFLHYLAAAAGLIEVAGGFLKPTLRGWSWLAATPQEQWQQLWEGWCDGSAASEQLWRHFHLPGHRTPAPLVIRDRLLHHLASRKEGWTAWGDFVHLLVVRDVSLAARWSGEQEETERILRGLLEGPLTWMGVVTWRWQDEDDPATVAFRLSARGEWLLGQKETGEPAAVARAFVLREDGSVEISLPADLRLAVVLSSFAEHVEGPAPDGVAWWRLTPDSMARAVSRGGRVEVFAEELREATGSDLPRQWPGLLRSWAQGGEAFRISRLTVLEAADRELLRQLRGQRRLRDCWERALSPRLVAIDEGKLPQLLRYLRRRGYWPQVRLPGGGEAPGGSAESQGLAGLWLAGRVYAEMARFIRLPAPPPQGALHQLERQLSPAAHSAAESALHKTLERLAQAVDGWAAHPAVRGVTDVERLLADVERALDEGRDLEIIYWTAGRDERSRRRVTPYWVEWRGRVAYLVGYCHHRQAERVFRADRVEEWRMVERGKQRVSRAESGV